MRAPLKNVVDQKEPFIYYYTSMGLALTSGIIPKGESNCTIYLAKAISFIERHLSQCEWLSKIAGPHSTTAGSSMYCNCSATLHRGFLKEVDIWQMIDAPGCHLAVEYPLVLFPNYNSVSLAEYFWELFSR